MFDQIILSSPEQLLWFAYQCPEGKIIITPAGMGEMKKEVIESTSYELNVICIESKKLKLACQIRECSGKIYKLNTLERLQIINQYFDTNNLEVCHSIDDVKKCLEIGDEEIKKKLESTEETVKYIIHPTKYMQLKMSAIDFLELLDRKDLHPKSYPSNGWVIITARQHCHDSTNITKVGFYRQPHQLEFNLNYREKCFQSGEINIPAIFSSNIKKEDKKDGVWKCSWCPLKKCWIAVEYCGSRGVKITNDDTLIKYHVSPWIATDLIKFVTMYPDMKYPIIVEDKGQKEEKKMYKLDEALKVLNNDIGKKLDNKIEILEIGWNKQKFNVLFNKVLKIFGINKCLHTSFQHNPLFSWDNGMWTHGRNSMIWGNPLESWDKEHQRSLGFVNFTGWMKQKKNKREGKLFHIVIMTNKTINPTEILISQITENVTPNAKIIIDNRTINMEQLLTKYKWHKSSELSKSSFLPLEVWEHIVLPTDI
jgi:hypothetical protein